MQHNVLSWTDANILEKPAISMFRAHNVPYTVKMEAAALSTASVLIYKPTQHHAKSEVPTVLMLSRSSRSYHPLKVMTLQSSEVSGYLLHNVTSQ
jgi:hypothetical protein